MNNQNTQETKPCILPQSEHSGPNQQEDEINLLLVFSALFSQWRWLVGITFAGTLIAVLIALILPKVYEIDAHLIPPNKVDMEALNTRGYVEFSQQELFNRYFNQLKSADHFRGFLVKNGWLNKFYPGASESEDEQFADIYRQFSTEVLEPKKKKGEQNDLPPSLLGIKLLAEDEVLGVKLVNDYIEYTNKCVIKSIGEEGLALKNLEKERIERQLTALRKKVEMDRVAKLVKLNEAYNIASAMGIKKPTTIEALAGEGGKSQTMVSVGNADQNVLALMGTDYLKNEMENLRNRAGSALFIEQIPELKQYLANIKNELGSNGFKVLAADNVYIEEFSDLMGRLTELNQITFDFNNVQIFHFDKTAMVDGEAEKPNKKLIVSLGFILSAMMAVFFVLIMNAQGKQR
ncbi:MAG: Wzz/FepE/Etk N-terminal domain-containing protein [Methylococcaceae bacterium]